MSQWLDRIKYGSGKNGSPAVSGTINTYAACTGTATQTSLTTALGAVAGDVILIHQSQGTGAGQWELNYVLADAGATLSLAYPLAYTYGTGAQAVLVPQYTGGTLSGAVTGTSWNGTVGGIIALMSNGDLTISGSITSKDGFRGGSDAAQQNQAWSGEGTTGATAQQYIPRGNGGGGGKANSSSNSVGCGGGGGNGTAGATGGGVGSYTPGQGGPVAGAAALTTMVFGGAGGGSGVDQNGPGGYGGKGGGIVVIFAKNITVSGNVYLDGTNGVTAVGGGGGGAGGSCLIKCQSATLGTTKITAAGGIGGQDRGNGGNGGVGRIHIDYADTYTGTTTPTIDATQVTTLKSQIYGSMV